MTTISRKVFTMCYLLTCLVSFSKKSVSQTTYYSLTKSDGTYTEITGGSAGSAFTCPFEVNIFGLKGHNLAISSHGDISHEGHAVFTFIGADMNMGSESYTVTGATGSRVLKIQFKDKHFADGWMNSDYVNFQIWFFEADSSIEVHMGGSVITQPSNDFYVYGSPRCYYGNTSTFKYYYMKGNENSPALDTAAASVLHSLPGSGTIYRLSRGTTATSVGSVHLNCPSLIVWPNPVANKMFVSLQTVAYVGDYLFTIGDLSGKIVKRAVASSEGIDLQDLRPGIYLCNVEVNGQVLSTRFRKD